MSYAKTVRGSTFRLALLLLAMTAGSACSRQAEFDKLFREKLAKRALACFHPLGEIKTAGPIKIAGGDAFRGTIYWQGGLSGNDYETRIEAKVGKEVATISLLADTSNVPSTETTCVLPLDESAVPPHEDEGTETSGSDMTSDMPYDSSIPTDAPPPP